MDAQQPQPTAGTFVETVAATPPERDGWMAISSDWVIEAVAVAFVAVIGFFVRRWVNGVDQKVALTVGRVTALEVNSVSRGDMQRLNDKLDERHDKLDEKLDKLILLLAHRRMGADDGT